MHPTDFRLVPRKVDLPSFDKANVEIWIRRVESAFTRAGIRTAKDKFAQMETKFGVDADPVINDFLYGTPSDTSWTAFLDHLRNLHGRTRRQEAQSAISGTPRDGKRPSSHYSLLLDKIGKATIDDVIKEHIIKGMAH